LHQVAQTVGITLLQSPVVTHEIRQSCSTIIYYSLFVHLSIEKSKKISNKNIMNFS